MAFRELYSINLRRPKDTSLRLKFYGGGSIDISAHDALKTYGGYYVCALFNDVVGIAKKRKGLWTEGYKIWVR